MNYKRILQNLFFSLLFVFFFWTNVEAATTANFIEKVPETGARFILSDSDHEMSDIKLDLDPNDNLITGSNYFDIQYRRSLPFNSLEVYGNGINNQNGDYSFDELKLELGAAKYDGWGIVWKDRDYDIYHMYGSNNYSEDYATNPLNTDEDITFFYTSYYTTPGSSISSVKSLLQEGAYRSTDKINTYTNNFNSNTSGISNYLEKNMGSSLIQFGDPDVFARYRKIDKVWVWTNNDILGEAVYEFDISYGTEPQNHRTEDISDLNATLLSTGVINIHLGPSRYYIPGSPFYHIDIKSSGSDNQSFDTTNRYLIPFEFQYSNIYDINVYSVNGEGDLSCGLTLQGFNPNFPDAVYPTKYTCGCPYENDHPYIDYDVIIPAPFCYEEYELDIPDLVQYGFDLIPNNSNYYNGVNIISSSEIEEMLENHNLDIEKFLQMTKTNKNTLTTNYGEIEKLNNNKGFSYKPENESQKSDDSFIFGYTDGERYKFSVAKITKK